MIWLGFGDRIGFGLFGWLKRGPLFQSPIMLPAAFGPTLIPLAPTACCGFDTLGFM